MKGLKRVLSLALVLSMAVAVTACGSDSEGSGSGDNVFVIGGLGPLSGEAASYGNSVKNGADIAIEEINAAGGVKVGDTTYTLQLKFQDDEAAAETAVTAYDTLMDEGINALLGCVTSGACLSVIDSTKEDGILQITPSGSAQDCTKYDNAFRLCFTDPVQGVTMADYSVDTLQKKNIAVIYNSGDEYSTGIKDAFEQQVASKGGTIVASEAFNKGDVDFKTQLTKIKGSNADIIFVPAYYNDVANICNQAKELNVNLPFIGCDGWDGVLDAVKDASVLEGAIFLSPFLATDTDSAVQAFVKKYTEKNSGKTPDQFAADGYDTVYVIKAAMEKAGSTDNAALIAAMTQIEVNGITGKVTFTANGEPNKSAKFVKIVNGAYTAIQ